MLKANEGFVADITWWVTLQTGLWTEKVQGREQTAILPSWKVDVVEVWLGWTSFNKSPTYFGAFVTLSKDYDWEGTHWGDATRCLYDGNMNDEIQAQM